MSVKKIKCIFIHGWGMNRAIWEPVIQQLPDWVDPIAIDLPGHGMNNQMSFESLDQLVDFCLSTVSEPAYWVGWSLGGMVATKLAVDYPGRVKALMLVANSPCFIRKDNWLHGMKSEVFDGFASSLEADYSATVQRFLSLQVQGSESGREILRQLRKKVLAMPDANIEALRAGLNLLKTVDLREQISGLSMPVQWILGDKDALVKKTLADVIIELQPDANVLLLKNAAHAPFLSHLDQFIEKLVTALGEVVNSRD